MSALGLTDGFDLWDALSRGTASPREEILLNIDPLRNASALRYRGYKLVVGTLFGGTLDGRYSIPSGERPGNDHALLRNHSKAARVLRRFYGNETYEGMDSTWDRGDVLKCENFSATAIFRSGSPAYLFDVGRDPCERYNLAESEKAVSWQIFYAIPH